MRTLTKEERRALRLAAVAAVTEQASKPLPDDAQKRAAEGLRRQGAAVRTVMDAARAKGNVPASPCDPGQMKAAIESVRLLVQAVFDFLRLFGVIDKSGAVI